MMTQWLYALQHPARPLANGRRRFGEIANFCGGYRARKPDKPPIPGATSNALISTLCQGRSSSLENDDSSRLIIAVLRAAAILSNLRSTLSAVRLIEFRRTSPFSSTYVCHAVWYGACLVERCAASNQL